MGGPRLDAFIVKIPAQLLPMAAHPTARVMHAGPPRGRSWVLPTRSRRHRLSGPQVL